MIVIKYSTFNMLKAYNDNKGAINTFLRSKTNIKETLNEGAVDDDETTTILGLSIIFFMILFITSIK